MSYGQNNFVLGAPEFVLRESFERYGDYVNQMSEQGYRVLAFAHGGSA